MGQPPWPVMRLDRVHVDAVEVGALLAVDLDGDEVLVELGGDLARPRTTRAPSRGTSGRRRSRCRGRSAGPAPWRGPAPPRPTGTSHRVVGVLEQVGAGLVDEAVGVLRSVGHRCMVGAPRDGLVSGPGAPSRAWFSHPAPGSATQRPAYAPHARTSHPAPGSTPRSAPPMPPAPGSGQAPRLCRPRLVQAKRPAYAARAWFRPSAPPMPPATLRTTLAIGGA